MKIDRDQIEQPVEKELPQTQPEKLSITVKQVVSIVLIVILITLLAAITLFTQNSARLSRDTIRENDLSTLKEALDLYTLNHRAHIAPPDTSFEEFAANLVPMFIENMPSDPGKYSYYYVRDRSDKAQYALIGKREHGETDVLIQFGKGSVAVDVSEFDGDRSTIPDRGVEFGF